MECAGVTLIHGCSTMEAFLDLVAMVPVGPSGAMCSVRHENDFAWKHAALRIECFCHAANTRFLPAALMAGRSRPDFHLLHIYYPLAFSPSRKAFHTLR